MKQRENLISGKNSERGYNLLEYGLIVATITITAVVALRANGTKFCSKINLAAEAVMKSSDQKRNLDPCKPMDTAIIQR
jgi:Flp pilus assembly pilin Flp